MANSDPAFVIPWQPSNLPLVLQQELNRRKINRSFNYIDANKQNAWGDNGDWQKYRGPMTSWVRLCSNGAGVQNKSTGQFDKQGFVFSGGKNFYTGYGFSKPAPGAPNNQTIIGYLPDVNSTPHVIDNDLKTSKYPIHVPAPEIESISVDIQRELFRRATVEWVCFSKAQLEYMTAYFLVPGLSCVLEWGWNHFDHSTLIDLTNISKLKDLHDNPYQLYTNQILQSKGNYDVLLGRITHFEWSVEGNKIKCKTEITSQDRIYAGLVSDANVVQQTLDSSGDVTNIKPLDNLTQFVDKVLPQFKQIITDPNIEKPVAVPKGLSDIKDPDALSQKIADVDLSLKLRKFVRYVKKNQPTNWRNYVYGIFYGRDLEVTNSTMNAGANKQNDFDYKNKNSDLWINVGLLMEVINYHASPLTSFKNREMFRVDIDDCVINAHPNLISTDGTILLVPNSNAPKYFQGQYGYNDTKTDTSDYLAKLGGSGSSTKPSSIKRITLADAMKDPSKLADYRLSRVCLPLGGHAFRDNLDEVINSNRYYTKKLASVNTAQFAFPFTQARSAFVGDNAYPANFSGNLKDLYFNVNRLRDILNNNTEIKTYRDLVNKILSDITSACANFWDLRLVSGMGDANLPAGQIAPMKIIDYNFSAPANRGTTYTFDYFDADSILQEIDFKPTLSNAVAIRTIFSDTNDPGSKTSLTNGRQDGMDYHFKDRLTLDEDNKATQPNNDSNQAESSQFSETMRNLQKVAPSDGSYQISNFGPNKAPLIRRLVMPANDVLKLLIDDGNLDTNPSYNGITIGIQASFTIQGIGGLRTFMTFLVRNLPEPYSADKIVFQIINVQETVSNGQWTTVITAGIRPLRDQFKKLITTPE